MCYVAPDQIGVRQISFGPSRGLQKELVGSGYRRELYGYETVRTFPRDVQVVEFTNNPTEGSSLHRVLSAINVPTVDGYPVSIDVSVLYRIANPYLVVSKFGFGKGYEDNVVIRFTDPIVKHHLGELRAEEGRAGTGGSGRKRPTRSRRRSSPASTKSPQRGRI